VFSVDVRFVFEVTDPRFLGEELLEALESVGAVTLEWPALKSRLEDLPLILKDLETTGLVIEPEFYDLCATHDWPGNLRELGLLVERAYHHKEFEIPIDSSPSGFERQALSLLLRSES